jgi:sugar lactone lactonase YvrE
MYVASSGSHQIVLVAPLSTVTGIGRRDEGPPLIGAANTPGAVDGHWSVTRFNTPTGLARSWIYGGWSNIPRQALFVADTGNHTIRHIRFRYGAEGCPVSDDISTLAGMAGQAGSQDGAGAAARFNTPRGVAAAPDGSLYVADTGNHTIRRIAVDGTVTTVAGEAGVTGMNDGPARVAHLNTPSGIDVDSVGEVFICDTGNHTIRELTRDGQLITIAGTPGVAGFADGDAAQAKFNGPVGVKVAPDGALIVGDTSNHVIRRIVSLRTEAPRRRSVRH